MQTTTSQNFSTTTPHTAKGAPARKAKLGWRVSPGNRAWRPPRVVPKLPMIGERKALRKRIVLSNTNALEVQSMQDLNAKNMTDKTQIGRVLGLDGELVDQLRNVKAFKRTQNWNMFRKPGTLIRRESVELARTLQDVKASHAEEKPRTVRRIISGEKSTGKSLMLLQAISMAFLNDWVVINVPEGVDYTISHSAYAPMTPPAEQQPRPTQGSPAAMRSEEASQQLMYSQPKLTAELLRRVSKTNEMLLKSIPLARNLDLGEEHQPEDLHSLALIGAQNSTLSWPVWQAFWKELTSPSLPRRPPVLFTVDGIDHWMALTKYMSAEYKPIHAQQLAPIQHFLDVLFNKDGAGILGNGGMILAATTGSNIPAAPEFGVLLRQLEAREQGLRMGDEGFPMAVPYKKADWRVLDLFSGSDGLEVQRLKGIDKEVEAKGLLEYYAMSGIMRETVSQSMVAEKWALAGGGVIGEIVRVGKRLGVSNSRSAWAA